MDTIDKIHELLYYALIDIRAEAAPTENKAVYHLADLFHNAVISLGMAAKGERSYDEVLVEIEDRSKLMGCEQWLTNQLKRCESKQREQAQK